MSVKTEPLIPELILSNRCSQRDLKLAYIKIHISMQTLNLLEGTTWFDINEFMRLSITFVIH